MFERELQGLSVRNLVPVMQAMGIALGITAPFLPYSRFLHYLYFAAGFAIAALVVSCVVIIIYRRSRTVILFAMAMSVIMLASMSELIAASFGYTTLLPYINHSVGAFLSSLLIALAIADNLRVEIYEKAIAESELKRTRDNMVEYLRKAQETEREYISTELHDAVCGPLSGFSLMLDGLAWQLSKVDGKYEALLHNAADDARRMLDSVRKISTGLRPEVMNKKDIKESLHWLATQCDRRHNMRVEFVAESLHGEDMPGRLSTSATIAVFRVAQEAISNVIKHAHATALKMMVKETDDELFLTIHDNGTGINLENIDSIPTMGLLNMRERILGVGGKFSIESGGHGTVINLSVPMERPRRLDAW